MARFFFGGASCGEGQTESFLLWVGFCKFNSFCVCNICEDVTNREEEKIKIVSLLFLFMLLSFFFLVFFFVIFHVSVKRVDVHISCEIKTSTSI